MTVVTIGCDPGKSSGLAVFEDVRLTFLWQGSCDLLHELLAFHLERLDGRDVSIALERYVQLATRGRRTPQNDALEVVGQVKALAARWNVDVELQSPADALALAPDTLLRQLGLFATGALVGCPDGDDANMAVRHALLHMAKRHNTLFAQLLPSV